MLVVQDIGKQFIVLLLTKVFKTGERVCYVSPFIGSLQERVESLDIGFVNESPPGRRGVKNCGEQE